MQGDTLDYNVTKIPLKSFVEHRTHLTISETYSRGQHIPQDLKDCTSYREDAPPRPVEGNAVHGRQVSQDPLVHLHVLVHGRGHQLPETVRAIQPAAETRLD